MLLGITVGIVGAGIGCFFAVKKRLNTLQKNGYNTRDLERTVRYIVDYDMQMGDVSRDTIVSFRDMLDYRGIAATLLSDENMQHIEKIYYEEFNSRFSDLPSRRKRDRFPKIQRTREAWQAATQELGD